MRETVAEAGEWIAETAVAVNNEAEGERVSTEGPQEVVAGKDYHSNAVLRKLGGDGVRSNIPEPVAIPTKPNSNRREATLVF